MNYKKNDSQKEGSLNFFGSLMKVGLPLIKNILTPLVKSVSVPLTAVASATDAAIQKKTFGSGATLMISYEEMNDIMKIAKSLVSLSLLIKPKQSKMK